ncbi:histidinol-phosphate transaminase [Cognatiluteimonas telluris]|uniref:histidinol-phosphate transaminase n=1 Tax=Cognatiluteimonas telluris TaxID=1104775 RepID=UPI00140824D3|nr:histidinol-phosphate transaminase [Lysobacter telluris]
MNPVPMLLRPDLRGFSGYRSARSESLQGDVWLNANESAQSNHADDTGAWRRYPQPQPPPLRAALATLYGCDEAQLLIGRGSDEPIDLLARAFCQPGRDAVLVTPPVFGMYAVCARLQGARVVEVPLRDRAAGFDVDLDQVALAARAQHARLVFLCSPGNPTGNVLQAGAVLALARALQDSALVVVDEAYAEFADTPSLVPAIAAQPNLAVLRTLSKAHALAGARIGCLVADPAVVSALQRCQAPYPVPAPCAELALAALSPAALRLTAANIDAMRAQRQGLIDALVGVACVRRVYPSQANFILARFDRVEDVFGRLLAAGVVVRSMREQPGLGDALRITVGTAAQNARLLDTLRTAVAA